ncbi:MAG: cupin domain-containing protein, partial [Lentisphaeria bacterium]|nr:cupin domain-containing protein [Lentisphaeria bacterium]
MMTIGFWRHLPYIKTFKIHNYENIWSDHSHSTMSAELLYVLEGKFTLTLASGLKFPAAAGDFLLLPSHAQHRDVFEPHKGLLMLLMQFCITTDDERRQAEALLAFVKDKFPEITSLLYVNNTKFNDTFGDVPV